MATDITLRRILAGPVDSAPTALVHTDWLYDTPPSALRQFYREYGVYFDQALAAAVGVLGALHARVRSAGLGRAPGACAR